METINKILTMTELQDVFYRAIELKEKYIGVRVETQGCSKPEIIINPNRNFTFKLDYYKELFNDDLTLKAYDGVKITGFMYGYDFAEIQEYLIG